MLSFDSRRKVVDSLKFGRKQEKGKFNEDFANSISDLIKSIKLNNQEAKSNGQPEESDADAIPFTLFTYLCQCAIQMLKPSNRYKPLHRCTLKTVRQTVGRSTLISPVANQARHKRSINT